MMPRETGPASSWGRIIEDFVQACLAYREGKPQSPEIDLAIGRLYDKIRPELLRVARLVGGIPDSEAEAIVNFALLKLVLSIKTGKYEHRSENSFRAWAKKITVNTTHTEIKKLWKRHTRETSLEAYLEMMPSAEPGTVDQAFLDVECSTLAELMTAAKVRPEDQRIVELFVRLGKISEVAEQIGCSRADVSRALYRARGLIRKYLASGQ
jgi:RNA polymerase sigma factor (sigma-70 family)